MSDGATFARAGSAVLAFLAFAFVVDFVLYGRRWEAHSCGLSTPTIWAPNRTIELEASETLLTNVGFARMLWVVRDKELRELVSGINVCVSHRDIERLITGVPGLSEDV